MHLETVLKIPEAGLKEVKKKKKVPMSFLGLQNLNTRYLRRLAVILSPMHIITYYSRENAMSMKTIITTTTSRPEHWLDRLDT